MFYTPPANNRYSFTQIDYYLRCTFPVWRHWTAKYTPKGRWAQGIQSACKRFAFATVILGLIWSRARPQDARQWALYILTARDSILSAIRARLTS